MTIEKINNFEDYEFQEVRPRMKGKLSSEGAADFNFQRFSKETDNLDENTLVKEFDVAHQQHFEIEESVVKLRKIQEEK